ncbi:MFS transporter [Microbacterium sp. Se5.02b]|nr:MFS transporter [Microbacterium sp. Se5.02b]
MASPSTSTVARMARPGAVLAIVLVSYFMIVLDNSIIFTGLTRIREDLSFTTSGLSWVQNAYALVFGGLLLLAARAGDIVGRRRTFLIGLAIFAVASLLIGVAPTSEWMIASRALQGVGSAILAPTSLALLTAHSLRAPNAQGPSPRTGRQRGSVRASDSSSEVYSRTSPRGGSGSSSTFPSVSPSPSPPSCTSGRPPA